MKLKIRIDENNPKHTKFTVFMNGANCGKLCMDSCEAYVFINAVRCGADAADLESEVEGYEG